MNPWLRILCSLSVIALVIGAVSCGQDHFATPEKTLSFYVENKAVGSNTAMIACLNCFTQSDQDWFKKNFRMICDKLYHVDCPPGDIQAETTIWTDKFEPAGPSSPTADAVQMDDKAGTATITVGGREYSMVKEGSDWKFDGFFGADANLQDSLHLN
jgi:hypothetical protein